MQCLTLTAASAEATASHSVDTWFTPGRFARLLATLILAMFPDVVLGERTFFYRDFSIFGYPVAHFHRECFWRGEWPLWNPHNNCGLPFLAQWNTMTLYPLSLFYLLFPLSWSLGVFCLGHLVLGGWGMYLLAHHWVKNGFAASVAGIAFAFNGLTWHALMWPNNIAALGWMPLVVLTVERAWREGGRRVVLAALVGAMQMLAGAPEIIFLTWTLLVVLWLAEGFRSANHRFWMGWPMWRRFVLVISLVGCLAAVQLFPFLDLLNHSQRSIGYGDTEWAMPGSGWANFLVPLFHTYRSFHGVFVQPGQHWTCSYYLGIGLIALAILAVWRVRQPRVWLLAPMALLSLILALGDQGYLFGWLRHVFPQLGFMRFPIKFVTLTVFILPLLAAYAVSWYRALPESRRLQERRSFLAVALILSGIIVVIVWLAYRHPMPKDDWSATWQNALVRAAFLISMVGGLVTLHHIQQQKLQWLCGLALLAVLWLDNLTHAPDLNPTVDRSVYASGLVRAGARFEPEPGHGVSRVMVDPKALAKMRHLSVATSKDECIGRRLALYGNLNLLDDVPKVNGFYSLYLREAEEVISSIYFSTSQPPARLMDFLNVSHTTAPDDLMEWAPRNSFLPMITAGQKPVFADVSTISSALADPMFEPQRVVYLSPEARSVIKITNATAVRILSSRFALNHCELKVEAAEPSMLVIAQAHYPAWKAYVDGTATQIWRANHAFQALQVPAGQHLVNLDYEDRPFYYGAGISGMTLLGCLLSLFRKPRLPVAGLA